MFTSRRFGLGIAISVFCLGLLFWQIDLKRVKIAVQVANWRALPIITAAYIAFMVLRGWRWQIILGNKVRYWPVFHAQSIGYLLTNILPFRLGDLGRAYLIGQHPGLSSLQALSSVALERVLDMLIIVLFFGLSLTMVHKMPPVIMQAGMMFATLSIILFSIMFLVILRRQMVLMITQRAFRRMKWLQNEVWLKRADSILNGLQSLVQWRQLIMVLGLSFVNWMAGAATFYWGIGAFWPEVTWPAAIFTLCIAGFGVSIPSSPSAIGVFHASVWLALSIFPATGEQALGFAFVYHALTFIIILILGSIGLWKNGQTLGEISTATRNLLAKHGMNHSHARE